MNNAKIALDSIIDEPAVDIRPQLRARETQLREIIEAISKVAASDYWHTLQTLVFDGVLEALQSRLTNEKNPTEMYRLQGQILWAKKYSKLADLVQAYENELTAVRAKLAPLAKD